MNSYLLALIGGSLIGLSASLLWLFLGRISGVSGILWQAIIGEHSARFWRLLFLLGLVLGAGLFHGVSGRPIPVLSASPGLIIVAGVLVGMGVNLGSGCTSGHGVCGISRGSIRSLVATLVFIGSGMLTVLLFGG